MEKLRLDIVTPERRLLAEEVLDVTLPSANGYMGIQPGHAPLMAMLQVGELSYHDDSGQHFLSVSGGYVEVQRDSVTVLAKAAELGADIDVERAQKAHDRAKTRLDGPADGVDVERAQVSLARALNRMSAHGRGRV